VNDAQRGFVIHRAGGHRADQGNLIGDGAGVRQQLRQLHAAPAAWTELVGRAEHVTRLLVEVDFKIPAGIRLAAPFVQRGFAVEEVHLARATVLEQADDRFRARTMLAGLRWIRGQRKPRAEELRQRQRAEAAGGTAEEGATGKGIKGTVHSR